MPSDSLTAILEGIGLRPWMARAFTAHADKWLAPAGGADYLADLLLAFMRRSIDRAYQQGRADAESATSGQLAFWSGLNGSEPQMDERTQ